MIVTAHHPPLVPDRTTMPWKCVQVGAAFLFLAATILCKASPFSMLSDVRWLFLLASCCGCGPRAVLPAVSTDVEYKVR